MKLVRVHTLLAVAGVTAVFGVLLKLTDVDVGERRTDSAPAPAARSSDPPAREGTVGPGPVVRREGPDTLGRDADGSATPDPPGTPAVGRFQAAPVPAPPRIAGPRPAGASRRVTRRQRKGGAKAAGAGVDVATAGSDTPTALGNQHDGPSPAAGPVAAAPDPRAATDEPPARPPDVAYESGEDLFSTAAPVDVPEIGKIAAHRGSVSF